MKLRILLILMVLYNGSLSSKIIKGKVLDEEDNPLIHATVFLAGTNHVTYTDEEGKFHLKKMVPGEKNIAASYVGYESVTKKVSIEENEEDLIVVFKLKRGNNLEEVEVFGERFRQPQKLEAITRMPLRPSEQIQSISVISNLTIEQQGALSITDAMRNVPGVTLFGSYGGVKESMSSRGYRGIPVLKNGVRMDSQYQTASGIIDMQGVESIQMIKGSAAITQGITTDLGNAGGVINVVTKTPKFENSVQTGLRIGSWAHIRPTFDYQTVLDKNKTAAFRINGAFERADNYRPIVYNEKVYINPSFEWRPDDKTQIILEADYMNSNATPVTSTVNFGDIGTEALYNMPHNKFLGLESDNENTKTSFLSARAIRQISEKFSLRVAYFSSTYHSDNTSTSLAMVKGDSSYHKRSRSISRSLRDDKNSTFQLDFIGKDVYTGRIKHTFQIGFDYRTADAKTKTLGMLAKSALTGNDTIVPIPVDIVDVTSENISNTYTGKNQFINPEAILPNLSKYNTYGIMFQEVMTINKFLKAILGLRYSSIMTLSGTTGSSKNPIGTADISPIRGNAWDPSLGIMVSPLENINLFASYTTSTSLRTAAQTLIDESKAGASVTSQWEVGIKSDWLKNRLRFNFTYFNILTNNLTNAEYLPGTNLATGKYFKAGDLRRKGIEVELNGHILSNLQAMIGYAYLDAQYQNSPSYVNGSTPMNAPKHTANSWIQYTVDKSLLKGLSIGIGVYHVGKRPVNEYSLLPDRYGNMGGIKPFDMPAYTTLNAQVGYTYNKWTARMFFNNLLDELGYNSYYRGGYINQINPRNFATQVIYHF